MENYLKCSVGVDISKEKFDACISLLDMDLNLKVKATRKFSNNKSGFSQFMLWIKKHDKQNLVITYTMEATGVYYERLAVFLEKSGCYVSVVLPGKAKFYLKSIGLKSKNDKIDARGLAQMGAEQKLDKWTPYPDSIYMFRSLTRQLENLNKQRTSYNNQLHAIMHSGFENKVVVRQLKQLIKLMDKQISDLKQEIQNTVDRDPQMKEKINKICKVKGLGLISVATIIAETNGFALFKKQSQLVSYAGYDVVENSSGKHKGKTKISKKGNSHIRRALHMPALNAKKYEPRFKCLYDRIYEKNKIKMKAYVAVQKKLLLLIYSLWKNNTEYIPDLHINSGNEEVKSLFSLGFKETEKVAPINKGATQDELPFNESAGALFSLCQS